MHIPDCISTIHMCEQIRDAPEGTYVFYATTTPVARALRIQRQSGRLASARGVAASETAALADRETATASTRPPRTAAGDTTWSLDDGSARVASIHSQLRGRSRRRSEGAGHVRRLRSRGECRQEFARSRCRPRSHPPTTITWSDEWGWLDECPRSRARGLE